MTIRTKILLHAALLLGAGAGLSGCVYDLGLSFASDGYYDDGYGCDSYGGYDAYYDCDYGQGFSNIGFGGGWYDNYYYPGYGIFLFDNVGRRYPMRDQYRRYWGEKRHNWYRENRRDRREGSRYDGRPGRYRQINNDLPPHVSIRRDRNDSRSNPQRDWRTDSNSRSRDKSSRPRSAPLPKSDIMGGQDIGRGRAESYGRPDCRGAEPGGATAPSPTRGPIPNEQTAQLVTQAPQPPIEPVRRQQSQRLDSERGLERPD